MAQLDEDLIFAWQLDGKGGGRRLDAKHLQKRSDFGPPVWVHLHYDKADAKPVLGKIGGLTNGFRADVTAQPRPVSAALRTEKTVLVDDDLEAGRLVENHPAIDKKGLAGHES